MIVSAPPTFPIQEIWQESSFSSGNADLRTLSIVAEMRRFTGEDVVGVLAMRWVLRLR